MEIEGTCEQTESRNDEPRYTALRPPSKTWREERVIATSNFDVENVRSCFFLIYFERHEMIRLWNQRQHCNNLKPVC